MRRVAWGTVLLSLLGCGCIQRTRQGGVADVVKEPQDLRVSTTTHATLLADRNGWPTEYPADWSGDDVTLDVSLGATFRNMVLYVDCWETREDVQVVLGNLRMPLLGGGGLSYSKSSAYCSSWGFTLKTNLPALQRDVGDDPVIEVGLVDSTGKAVMRVTNPFLDRTFQQTSPQAVHPGDTVQFTFSGAGAVNGDVMVMARSTLRQDTAWPARMTSFTTLEVTVPMDLTPASYDLQVFTMLPVTVQGCEGPANCEWVHTGDWPIHHAADPTRTPGREGTATPVMGSGLVDVTAP